MKDFRTAKTRWPSGERFDQAVTSPNKRFIPRRAKDRTTLPKARRPRLLASSTRFKSGESIISFSLGGAFSLIGIRKSSPFVTALNYSGCGRSFHLGPTETPTSASQPGHPTYLLIPSLRIRFVRIQGHLGALEVKSATCSRLLALSVRVFSLARTSPSTNARQNVHRCGISA